jgi:hypothetical protein
LPSTGFAADCVKCEAEAEEKTSETIITKIFNELPVP